MTTPVRKKLIEVSIPLDAINAASKKQKAPKGYPTALHKYWAHRPLAACRAILFSQLVDDPSSWPEKFATREAQETERRRLHRLITRMTAWEASQDERILNEARWEIARSIAWGRGQEPPSINDPDVVLQYLQRNAPPVYDPFSGIGSIPLEAQRLGLRAFGSDLNPVAVLIGKALVEIPSRFNGRPPVNPEAREERQKGWVWNGRGARGLAEDVRFYGKWIRDEAWNRVGHLYPPASLNDGTKATVIAWIWARTVRSPNPAARGAMVPLVSSFMLSTKEGKKAWIDPVIDSSARDGYRLEIRSGTLSTANEEALKKGTVDRRGARCMLTDTAIDYAYLRKEAKAGRMSVRLLSVVAEGHKGRIYLSPTDEQEAVSAISCPDAPLGEISHWPGRTNVVEYGMTTFSSLFTARQKIALTTFSDLVIEARGKVLSDARSAAFHNDDVPLHAGGSGAEAYADAVTTYLSFLVSRAADYGSSLSTWLTDDNAIRGTFGRQALPMTWDFCEGNYFGDSSAALDTILRTVTDVIAHQQSKGIASICQIDAANISYREPPYIINTDPPYYGNIGYADLSDFFYGWLKRSLSNIWPELFRRLATPKAQELIAMPYRFAGGSPPDWVQSSAAMVAQWSTMKAKERAEAFFMHGMSAALTAMNHAATDSEPLVIYYAFKQAEIAKEGLTSAGWASFLQAVIAAGLSVDGTWPLRTESAGRLIGRRSNALASSIVLVCRKRPPDASVTTRSEFIRMLKREMPDAIDAIRKAGVGPVDMQQSIIGPGMGAFSRYAKVLEDDDSQMTVKTALALINRVWEEIENELDAAFDPETQVALAWFSSFGFDARPSGDLITLTTAKNTSDRALFASGVFKDMKGKTALTRREDLPSQWDHSSDTSPTVWECVQHTARELHHAAGGGDSAARLVGMMGQKSGAARALAYRLFEISTKRGWVSEALIYNQLAEEWPRLDDAAAAIEASVATNLSTQRAFDFDGDAA